VELKKLKELMVEKRMELRKLNELMVEKRMELRKLKEYRLLSFIIIIDFVCIRYYICSCHLQM
jgi:hypothetical protein